MTRRLKDLDLEAAISDTRPEAHHAVPEGRRPGRAQEDGVLVANET
jgi:hypothetical protein